jgi:putative oxygen-independent coproporphyrinogen III oxidase
VPTLPDGDLAPADGRLPDDARARAEGKPYGLYVHVPFCATRCGYCDFNTYTLREVGDLAPQRYVDAVIAELDLAAKQGPTEPVQTVFFGGGTPTFLGADALRDLLTAIRERFPVASDAEVTTEANPDSVDAAGLVTLETNGFTRISFGMQSARRHVLDTLDRMHTPGRSADAVREARSAGFAHVSVDLIYGTPGETDDDWAASLDEALATGVDHVSAYALTVEPGTRMAAAVRRGDLSVPDPDVQAARYEAADRTLHQRGFRWYEISNWARTPADRCRHNLLYWTAGNWWGVGPGAHSHVGGVRWWNVKHPAGYAARLEDGASPAAAREILDERTREVERVMLGIRLADGLPVATLDPQAVTQLVAEGLLTPVADRVALTMTGRLLADLVVRRLTG